METREMDFLQLGLEDLSWRRIVLHRLCCFVDDCFLDQRRNCIFVSGYNRRIVFHFFTSLALEPNGSFVGERKAVRNPLGQSRTIGWPSKISIPAHRAAYGGLPVRVPCCKGPVHQTGQVENTDAPVEIDIARAITSALFYLRRPCAGINIGDGCWGGGSYRPLRCLRHRKRDRRPRLLHSWGRDPVGRQRSR